MQATTTRSMAEPSSGTDAMSNAPHGRGLANPRARPGDPLTPRETEVLALVAAGEPTAAIAARLAISENTVKGHLTHVYAKTGSRNRVQAVRFYLDHNGEGP